MKYEYKTVTLIDEFKLAESLNAYGAEGWLFVGWVHPDWLDFTTTGMRARQAIFARSKGVGKVYSVKTKNEI